MKNPIFGGEGKDVPVVGNWIEANRFFVQDVNHQMFLTI
jgi:hypothetical protein